MDVPKGPWAGMEPMTAVMGCLSRSVRDTARYFDCCNGFDQRDPRGACPPSAGGRWGWAHMTWPGSGWRSFPISGSLVYAPRWPTGRWPRRPSTWPALRD